MLSQISICGSFSWDYHICSMEEDLEKLAPLKCKFSVWLTTAHGKQLMLDGRLPIQGDACHTLQLLALFVIKLRRRPVQHILVTCVLYLWATCTILLHKENEFESKNQ